MSVKSRWKEKMLRRLEPKPWYKKMSLMQWWIILCTAASLFFLYRLYHPGPHIGWW